MYLISVGKRNLISVGERYLIPAGAILGISARRLTEAKEIKPRKEKPSIKAPAASPKR
jgi:hypothetical protein